MNYPNQKDNPARQALTHAIDKALAEGAPVYVNEPAPKRKINIGVYSSANPKIDCFVSGVYYRSTNWYTRCKDARAHFCDLLGYDTKAIVCRRSLNQ